jgi:hypothetical protein
MNPLRTLALSAVFALPALAQGKVWVVDDDPALGVDFTTLQAAIDAAHDGDLLLVKAGTYAGFTIDGKSLALTAELGAVVGVSSMIRVTNLAADQRVVLRGIDRPQIAVPAGTPKDVLVSNCLGVVWFEDCLLSGLQGVESSTPLMRVESSVSVALERCFVASTLLSDIEALRVSASSVHAHDTQFAAGTPFGNGASLPGVRLEPSSFLYAQGGSIQGGMGPACQFQPGCVAPPAGPGLSVASGAQAVTLNTSLQGGSAGFSGFCFGGVPCQGTNGPPVKIESGGSHAQLQEIARHFECVSPVRAGTSKSVKVQAYASDFVVALYAARPHPAYLPGVGSLLLPFALGTETQIYMLGPVGTGGTLQKSIDFAELPPSIDFLEVFAQAVCITPQLVTVTTGGSVLHLLNQAL